jgi:preprotein translocase subunit SecB
MSQSVLQLERYFISKVQIEAVQKTSFPAEIGSSTKLEVARNNQEPNKYVVSLTVAIAGSDQKPPPYVGEVQVIGFFQVHPELPPEKQSQIASVTGASILYGVAREMIANVTARGPWPGVTLPCVSFNEPEPQPQAKPIEQAAAAK